jgi:hypothetical protein
VHILLHIIRQHISAVVQAEEKFAEILPAVHPALISPILNRTGAKKTEVVTSSQSGMKYSGAISFQVFSFPDINCFITVKLYLRTGRVVELLITFNS